MEEIGIPFLRAATELLAVLQSSDLSKSELCRFLALKTFADLDIRSIALGEVKNIGKVSVTHAFGIEGEMREAFTEIPLTSDMPLTRAINLVEPSWMDYESDVYQEYPALKDFPRVPEAKTLIWVPIVKHGNALGGLGVLSRKVITPGLHWNVYFELIAEIVAIRYEIVASFAEKRSGSIRHKSIYSQLNEREEHILELIALNLTNGQIAARLGYSESTIRQYTISIYRKIGVSGRDEAKAHYLRRR